MLKKTIKYTDFDGNEREEDFYFNLTQAEVTELQFSKSGGLQKMLQKIIASQDTVAIMEQFKKIILLSYGVKSDDGRRFIKSPELSKEFSETEAYSQLFMELATDDKAASAFITAVMPKEPQDHKTSEKQIEKKPEKVQGEIVQMPTSNE